MVAQKRVAIYARVSTVEKARRRRRSCWHSGSMWHTGDSLAGEYVDYASGTREDRPQYRALLDMVRKRQVDIVLVWRYDRFAAPRRP